MVVCPNCTHQNPEGAAQCEACFTPLPATTACPNCGAPVQTDATFCGQCGQNLRGSVAGGTQSTPVPNGLPDIPDLVPPDPHVTPDPIVSQSPEPVGTSGLPPTVVSQPGAASPPEPVPQSTPSSTPVATTTPVTPTPPPPAPIPTPGVAKTQLQQQTAKLMHLQTNTSIELPSHIGVIHLGKPNDQIPPDIDVSGFPHSEVVSRIHADIRAEGGNYFIEDVGSANGTYINHTPLLPGNRHRLRPGDRIALGKGDLVTFLFQIS